MERRKLPGPSTSPFNHASDNYAVPAALQWTWCTWRPPASSSPTLCIWKALTPRSGATWRPALRRSAERAGGPCPAPGPSWGHFNTLIWQVYAVCGPAVFHGSGTSKAGQFAGGTCCARQSGAGPLAARSQGLACPLPGIQLPAVLGVCRLLLHGWDAAEAAGEREAWDSLLMQSLQALSALEGGWWRADGRASSCSFTLRASD